MERMMLEAEVRPVMSKGQLNQIRLEDKVPAVLYGRGKESQPLVVEGRLLRQVLISGGSNVLIDLKVKDKGKKAKQETVMFKEIERHIFHKDRVTHVDFIRISMTDKIEVAVQLIFAGEPVGVREGGVLQILLREVAVKCLPADIPESMEIDLSALSIGDSISVGSLALPADVELITDPEESLAQVLVPIQEEKPAGEAEAEQAEASAQDKEEA
ncbi:MAG: 50S ribosomal protein L25 [Bacillota bacterium]